MALESIENRQKKAATIERIYELFGQNKQILLANFTNVGSAQIQVIRKMLRPFNGTLVISKNTMIKKILKMRTQGIKEAEFKHLAEQHGGVIKELEILSSKMEDKVALIFCDASVFELKNKIEANKIPTEARVGANAPIDFTVPAGGTGLDPSQINFFHALNISTKIVKGQIEITKDFKVCTAGKKVKASEAALLKKLNIKPFSYGMKLSGVYSDGAILPEAVLNIDPSSLLGKFENGVKNIAGLSLSAGYPIEATIPLIISNSFKNIAALSIESGFKVKEVEALSSAPQGGEKAEKGEKGGDKGEKGDKKPEKGKEAAKKAEEPKKAEEAPPAEEDEGGMGDLFG